MPIQPPGARGTPGRVELRPELEPGLQDIEGFSHLLLIYHLHRAPPGRLRVTPFLDAQARGIFATRAPARPNPIGLSVVRLVRREGATLHIEDVDVLDGTPLLDLKPYVPAFDGAADVRVGWFEGRLDALPSARADGRFERS
jgi:tRNA-Thr(GGU) m(6)t(6)A37 methyltransferase TsaA